MDVGPTNGETGALKPPKEISSVVAPSEKELFIFYLDDTFFHNRVNTNHQRETTPKQILITSQNYYFSNIKNKVFSLKQLLKKVVITI
jgi:hypothetical protein